MDFLYFYNLENSFESKVSTLMHLNKHICKQDVTAYIVDVNNQVIPISYEHIIGANSSSIKLTKFEAPMLPKIPTPVEYFDLTETIPKVFLVFDVKENDKILYQVVFRIKAYVLYDSSLGIEFYNFDHTLLHATHNEPEFTASALEISREATSKNQKIFAKNVLGYNGQRDCLADLKTLNIFIDAEYGFKPKTVTKLILNHKRLINAFKFKNKKDLTKELDKQKIVYRFEENNLVIGY